MERWQQCDCERDLSRNKRDEHGELGALLNLFWHVTDRQTDRQTDRTDRQRQRLESKRPRVNGDRENNRLRKYSHAISEVWEKRHSEDLDRQEHDRGRHLWNSTSIRL